MPDSRQQQLLDKEWWYQRLDALDVQKEKLVLRLKDEQKRLKDLVDQNTVRNKGIDVDNETLKDLEKEKSLKTGEHAKITKENTSLKDEIQRLEKDCHNLERTLKNWENSVRKANEVTKEYAITREKLEEGVEIDGRRKESLTSGLDNGEQVKEKLRRQVAKEREKQRQLEEAWEEKQGHLYLEAETLKAQVESVAHQEEAIAAQTDVIHEKIRTFLNTDFAMAKQRFEEMEAYAIERLREKSLMFDQLRSLQAVHQRTLQSHEDYSNRVNALENERNTRASLWRLNHIQALDERIQKRKERQLAWKHRQQQMQQIEIQVPVNPENGANSPGSHGAGNIDMSIDSP